MKRGKCAFLLVIFLFLVVLFSNLVYSGNIEDEWHLKLLAVQESEGNYTGSIADLYLEIKEGSGRVFLATFPLTKLDTQISTRFAKDIACNYFNLDCENYDFIYTIKAESNIIGGPSAGAAISALTTIAMLDLDYDDKVTITGTINSGGIVGPIGGTKEKIEAASKDGIDKVMITSGNRNYKENNETIDLVSYAKDNLGLKLVEVGDLNEVVFHLTGKKLKKDDVSVKISSDYQDIMKELSDLLCNRTEELEKESSKYDVDISKSERVQEKKNSSKVSLENEDYYSSASFCFGANILIGELIYDKQKLGIAEMVEKTTKLKEKVKFIESSLQKEKIETISDLQTFMIVKERLDEVKEKIEKFNTEKDKSYALAYAEERFFSAVSWMYFFKMEGKKFVFDEKKLSESCTKKISESKERYQYVELIFGAFDISYIKEKITSAEKKETEKEYGLCLIKAAQAKAEANSILNVMGLSDDNLDNFLESKTKSVEKVIAESSQEDVFPILGYSYYQYANSLKKTEKQASLLYLEYALEMSDLDIYFEEGKTKLLSNVKKSIKFPNKWTMFGIGIVFGFLVALAIVFITKRVICRKKITRYNTKIIKNKK